MIPVMAFSFVVSLLASRVLGVRGAITAYFAGPASFGFSEMGLHTLDITAAIADGAMPALYWFVGSYPGAAVGLYMRPWDNEEMIVATFGSSVAGDSTTGAPRND